MNAAYIEARRAEAHAIIKNGGRPSLVALAKRFLEQWGT